MTKKISSAIDIICGLLLSIGPWTIFEVCSRAEKIMKCYYSARAVTVIGILLIVVGVIRLIIPNVKQTVPCLISSAIYLAAISIPSWAIGGCVNTAMNCQRITFPCIYAICVIGIVAQVFFAIKSRKE